MFEKELEKALNEMLKQDRNKRKFTQSAELIVNTKNVDFTKPENRINIDVVLPHGIGKEKKVMVFADGQLQIEAKQKGCTVYGSDSLEELKNNKKELVKQLKDSVILAQPQLMPVIAKTLGPILGRKKKLPIPITRTLDQAIDIAKRTVKIHTSGKYLPTIMCIIGNEKMSEEQLVENASTVLESIIKKNPAIGFKSIYVKLTMGKPQKVI